MITLDASFVIALRSTADRHATAAHGAFSSASGPRRIHPVTLAEILVDPARHQREEAVRRALVLSGISLWRPDDDEPLRVARLRAETRLALPGCYVLALAEQTGSSIASFDERLRRTARERGIGVVPTG